jgi:hypothetical protein
MTRTCRYCARPRVKGFVACRIHLHLLVDTMVVRRVRRLAR